MTAWTREDALTMLERQIPEDMKAITGCIEDIDVSTLDPRRILPNIGDVTVRGIWFPLSGSGPFADR